MSFGSRFMVSAWNWYYLIKSKRLREWTLFSLFGLSLAPGWIGGMLSPNPIWELYTPAVLVCVWVPIVFSHRKYQRERGITV